jgi:hypothetical protein
VGCGSTAPSNPPSLASAVASSPVASSQPTTTTPTASVEAPSATARASTSTDPSPSASAAAIADPRLFALIGGDAGTGLTFQYDPDTTARVAADPGLGADAAALAIGLYTPTGENPVTDYAIVSIVRLRNPKPDEAWFRSYRDSYDVSACAQAGGVARHAETQIAGRNVFIAGCTGGAFTYHVFVAAHGAVVSITSVGPGALGQRLANDIEN